jgi:nucleoside-diphosphate-sugar epimerase
VKSSTRAFGARNSGERSWQRPRPRSRADLSRSPVGQATSPGTVAQLLNEGWRARTTVRNLGAAEEVRATISKITANAGTIEFMAADLNSEVGWANVVAGADYVLHVASPVPIVDPKSDDELVRPARDGTLRVLEAARDAGGKRLVMTSSISAIMFGRGVREKPFTEADWTDETNRDDTSPYDRAKTIAERAA